MVKITETLEMEEADQADAITLNYVLEKRVESQGRLTCGGGQKNSRIE